MDTALTSVFFKYELKNHVTINFDKDILPYDVFFERPSLNITPILDTSDRWLNLYFPINGKFHYFSIGYINDTYHLFETEDNSSFVEKTTFKTTDQLFNMLLEKLKQAPKEYRKHLLTIDQKGKPMITLTEGQLTYLDIILSLVIFILAVYVIDKWGKKEKYTIREKIVIPLLAIATIFLINNSFITDLRLNNPTITTTTTVIYDGKNADDSTLTQVKHSDSNYYDIKRTHYAPTDIRLSSALKQPITYYNQLILTIISKDNSDFDRDYDIQKTTVKGKGTIVSKLTLTTHKRIYKNRWSVFALVDKTYELTATV